MIEREFWKERIASAWKKTPIVWLSGVRRVGKTTLAQMFGDALYLNCDLPSTGRLLGDAERFYRGVTEPCVVFDEVHQLPDPSRLLKIGADEFPAIKVLATGSSTLAATQKFRDSLTGRKRNVHLLPVLAGEIDAFGVGDLRRRLLHGGLPEPLLASAKDAEFFAEWLDSFYARDVQELFRVGKRQGFLRLSDLLMRSSGGLAEITSLSKATGLSRPTVMSYLDILQVTHVVSVLRPFHGGGRQEVLRQPKIYGFDTGFVTHYRGWTSLREEDCGLLWEHLVLETLQARLDPGRIHFWRDRLKREVDFVVAGSRGSAAAIECKWDPDRFSRRGIDAFRALHPRGENFVVSPQAGRAHTREIGGHEVTFCNLEQLVELLD
jgi:predicted AAA+ superfamily ATPase